MTDIQNTMCIREQDTKLFNEAAQIEALLQTAMASVISLPESAE